MHISHSTLDKLLLDAVGFNILIDFKFGLIFDFKPYVCLKPKIRPNLSET